MVVFRATVLEDACPAAGSSASTEVGGLPCAQSMFLSSKRVLFLYTLQGPEHPNPGKSFTARGFPRHCYLPDSEKGRKVRGSLGRLELAKACSRAYRGGRGSEQLFGAWVEVFPVAHPACSALG